MASVDYVIKTNLDPEGVNAIGLIIYAKWLDFALGHTVLNGKRLIYPSGKYASSISYQQEGEATVAIVADEGVAPEAAVIEHGHGPVDLKTKLQSGRAYPMHRPVNSNAASSLRRVGAKPASTQPHIWAEMRARTASGFASIGPNSGPDSWIIPAMPAYAPGMALAAMAKKLAGGT